VMTTSSSAGWDSGEVARAWYETTRRKMQTRLRKITCSLRRY
jgi:hypothetical protein